MGRPGIETLVDAVESELAREIAKTTADILNVELEYDLVRNEFAVWAHCTACLTRYGVAIEGQPNEVGPVLAFDGAAGKEIVPPESAVACRNHDELVAANRARADRNRFRAVLASSVLARILPVCCSCISDYVASYNRRAAIEATSPGPGRD